MKKVSVADLKNTTFAESKMRTLLLLLIFFSCSLTLDTSDALGQANKKRNNQTRNNRNRNNNNNSAQQRKRQADQARQRAQTAARKAEQYLKTQYIDSLNALAQDEQSQQNSGQNRLAFDQAVSDFRVLRAGDVQPNKLGEIQIPFRLLDTDFDRATGTIIWPELLRGPSYNSITGSLDEAFRNNGIKNEQKGTAALEQLKQLNTTFNRNSIEGEIAINDFARARRLITGLGNEIRSKGHGLGSSGSKKKNTKKKTKKKKGKK